MTTPTTGHEYTLSRDLEAPVEKVWKVWTRAEHYENWFHAVPGSVALDVRPGGAWRATMRSPDGNQVPMTGTYREVAENRRLVVAMDIPGREPAVMEMDFAEVGGGKTRLVVKQACDTAEECEQSRAGSELLLEWCAAYLAAI